MDKKIVITSMPLSVDIESAKKMTSKDEVLVHVATQIMHRENKFEVFNQIDNMLITSKGYLFAFYEDDLELV